MSVLIKNMILYMDSKFVQDHKLYWVMTLNVINAQNSVPLRVYFTDDYNNFILLRVFMCDVTRLTGGKAYYSLC